MPKFIFISFLLLSIFISCDGENFETIDVNVDPELDTVYVQALSAPLTELILDFKEINRHDTFRVYTLYCTDLTNNEIAFILSNYKAHRPFSIGSEEYEYLSDGDVNMWWTQPSLSNQVNQELFLEIYRDSFPNLLIGSLISEDTEVVFTEDEDNIDIEMSFSGHVSLDDGTNLGAVEGTLRKNRLYRITCQ